jgi:hypothetical protein
MKLSPTPTTEDDEQYEDTHRNYEAEHYARWRHMGEDLIWRTHMQREEYNLNQHHGNLTFMKHIYIDVNVDVITMRPRFVQQE